MDKNKKTPAELSQIFWAASDECLFTQATVAAVLQRGTKTLERDRWKNSGLPYRKLLGSVLYKKSEVLEWIEQNSKLIKPEVER